MSRTSPGTRGKATICLYEGCTNPTRHESNACYLHVRLVNKDDFVAPPQPILKTLAKRFSHRDDREIDLSKYQMHFDQETYEHVFPQNGIFDRLCQDQLSLHVPREFLAQPRISKREYKEWMDIFESIPSFAFTEFRKNSIIADCVSLGISLDDIRRYDPELTNFLRVGSTIVVHAQMIRYGLTWAQLKTPGKPDLVASEQACEVVCHFVSTRESHYLDTPGKYHDLVDLLTIQRETGISHYDALQWIKDNWSAKSAILHIQAGRSIDEANYEAERTRLEKFLEMSDAQRIIDKLGMTYLLEQGYRVRDRTETLIRLISYTDLTLDESIEWVQEDFAPMDRLVDYAYRGMSLKKARKEEVKYTFWQKSDVDWRSLDQKFMDTVLEKAAKYFWHDTKFATRSRNGTESAITPIRSGRLFVERAMIHPHLNLDLLAEWSSVVAVDEFYLKVLEYPKPQYLYMFEMYGARGFTLKQTIELIKRGIITSDQIDAECAQTAVAA